MHEPSVVCLFQAHLTPRTDGCSWEIPQGLRRGSAQGMMQAHKSLWSPNHSAWIHTTTKHTCLILLHTPPPSFSNARKWEDFHSIASQVVINHSQSLFSFVNYNLTRYRSTFQKNVENCLLQPPDRIFCCIFCAVKYWCSNPNKAKCLENIFLCVCFMNVYV